MPSGRFLIRSRIRKPAISNEERDFFKAEDLFVGAIVIFNEHSFLLTEADEYVFAFMERFEVEEIQLCQKADPIIIRIFYFCRKERNFPFPILRG